MFTVRVHNVAILDGIPWFRTRVRVDDFGTGYRLARLSVSSPRGAMRLPITVEVEDSIPRNKFVQRRAPVEEAMTATQPSQMLPAHAKASTKPSQGFTPPPCRSLPRLSRMRVASPPVARTCIRAMPTPTGKSRWQSVSSVSRCRLSRSRPGSAASSTRSHSSAPTATTIICTCRSQLVPGGDCR